MRTIHALGSKPIRSSTWSWVLLLLFGSSLLVSPPARAQTESQTRSGNAEFGHAQSWYFRTRTTGYAYTTAPKDAIDDETNHFEFYQYLDGAVSGFAQGKLDLRLSGRFADDFAFKANPTTPYRLYSGYLQAHLSRRDRLRLGRLFVQEGVANYTMDGLYLALRPTPRLKLRAWGGARSPYNMEWEASNLSDETALGAHAIALLTPWMNLGVDWSYLEHNGARAYQKVGAEASLRPGRGLRTILRAHYETESEQWDQAELLAWYRPTPGWPMLNLQYLDRRQSVEKNTYWERFLPSLDRVRLARASARYENEEQWGLEVEYFGSFVDEFEQTRLGGAVLFPYGRLGYSLRLGDAGEESRWYGDLRWQPVGWWNLSGGAMLSTYALLKDAPEDLERDLVTLYARSVTRLRDGLNLHLEFQSLDNPQYSKDMRFLVGIDLAMGRGASRTGLGTGGWLQ